MDTYNRKVKAYRKQPITFVRAQSWPPVSKCAVRNNNDTIHTGFSDSGFDRFFTYQKTFENQKFFVFTFRATSGNSTANVFLIPFI